jgi:hypothetical protein
MEHVVNDIVDDFTLDELSISGRGVIERDEAIGPLSSGEGCMVLMTVHHQNNVIRRLVVDGDTITTTDYHRFWSVDRGAWTQAHELIVGEAIGGLRGTLHVEESEALQGVQEVYNLEVEGQHTYFVGDVGAWVHNSCNQMNKQIQRGQAPRSVQRVDRGKVTGEQDHIHFTDDSALNKDGSWKHGGRELTSAEAEWVQSWGWTLPAN